MTGAVNAIEILNEEKSVLNLFGQKDLKHI